jgi:hypothetical protein
MQKFPAGAAKQLGCCCHDEAAAAATIMLLLFVCCCCCSGGGGRRAWLHLPTLLPFAKSFPSVKCFCCICALFKGSPLTNPHSSFVMAEKKLQACDPRSSAPANWNRGLKPQIYFKTQNPTLNLTLPRSEIRPTPRHSRSPAWRKPHTSTTTS